MPRKVVGGVPDSELPGARRAPAKAAAQERAAVALATLLKDNSQDSVMGRAGARRRWSGCWRLAGLMPFTSRPLRRWPPCAQATPRIA